jgi:hypothetical protein
VAARQRDLVFGLFKSDLKVAAVVARALDDVEPQHFVHLVDTAKKLLQFHRVAHVCVAPKLDP